MAVTTSNLIMGPAQLYIGAFGAQEPSEADVSNAVENTSASGNWVNLGGTNGGVTLTITQTYTPLTVDQITMTPESRRTEANATVATNLAEPTLANLTYVLNGGPAATGSGSGYETFGMDVADSSTQPTYRAIILDGFAPGGKRRRVIVRKALSTESVESAYSKEGQTFFPVTFTAHYVDSVTVPVYVVDETSA